MNWTKGIIRLVWVVAICVGIVVLLFGCSVLDASGILDARTDADSHLPLPRHPRLRGAL